MASKPVKDASLMSRKGKDLWVFQRKSDPAAVGAGLDKSIIGG